MDIVAHCFDEMRGHGRVKKGTRDRWPRSLDSRSAPPGQAATVPQGTTHASFKFLRRQRRYCMLSSAHAYRDEFLPLFVQFLGSVGCPLRCEPNYVNRTSESNHHQTPTLRHGSHTLDQQVNESSDHMFCETESHLLCLRSSASGRSR